MDTKFDIDQFEQEWISLAEEIVKRVFANSRVQEIKHSLKTNGFLSWEEKNDFITLTDQIKNELIHS